MGDSDTRKPLLANPAAPPPQDATAYGQYDALELPPAPASQAYQVLDVPGQPSAYNAYGQYEVMSVQPGAPPPQQQPAQLPPMQGYGMPAPVPQGYGMPQPPPQGYAAPQQPPQGYAAPQKPPSAPDSVTVPMPGTPMDTPGVGTPNATPKTPGSEEPKSGMGCWEHAKIAPHTKAILATAIVLCMISLTVYSVATGGWSKCPSSCPSLYDDDPYSTDDDSASCFHCNGVQSFVNSSNTIWFVLMGVSYLLYWIEGGLSHSRKYLSNFRIVESVEDYVQRLWTHAPHIWWHIQCYHWETRIVTEWYTDSNGNRRSRTRTERYRVNTHSASGHYHFDDWRDISKPISSMPEIYDYEICKIHYLKDFVFSDEFTRNHYHREKRQWIDYHDRDTHKDVTSGLRIHDFSERMLSTVRGGSHIPRCLNIRWYLFWTFFLCTVPYRYWFGSVSGFTKYRFLKEIHKNRY